VQLRGVLVWQVVADCSYSKGVNSAFFAEVMAAIIAIDKPVENRWDFFWLKTYSSLLKCPVLHTFIAKEMLVLIS